MIKNDIWATYPSGLRFARLILAKATDLSVGINGELTTHMPDTTSYAEVNRVGALIRKSGYNHPRKKFF